MRGEPLRILLVEDNDDHAEVIRRSFADHLVANEIHHVTDGAAALDYLLRRNEYSDPNSSPKPHVILLDLRLPKVDGLDVLKIIKNTPELLRIPVVVLTTSHAESDVALAYDSYVNSYLVKPLDFDGFTKLMSELGYYWLAWNINPWSDYAQT